ncbi:hypothetical protein G6F68_018881 [Rhizopus microsporus]|uniref:Uncharacterized protein n=1 Tax=Rhizopus delemar TaxID=936053 RepID=A0A9P6XR99_9FUNG|nr:hypothetical protein G6F68_018881 [Rhizopus microsporus]KAG1530388.1 hypothetical protein G6F50_017350 [Rhizopus delemar]
MVSCALAVPAAEQACIAISHGAIRLAALPAPRIFRSAMPFSASLFHGVGRGAPHGLTLGHQQCVTLIDAYRADPGKFEVDNDV